MHAVRDRIQGFCRIPANRLEPHPRNWRLHPPHQRAALEAVLRDIGYAGALLARELTDGRLQLIDGHLRAETTPDQEVPVLIVDLSDDEALKLLAVHDPLAALAEPNVEMLQAIYADLKPSGPARELIAPIAHPKRPGEFRPRAAHDMMRESFQVVVECADEREQRAVFDRLSGEGLRCRLLNF